MRKLEKHGQIYDEGHKKSALHNVRWGYAAALIPQLFGNSIPGQTTRAPLMQTQHALRVELELATDSIQFYDSIQFQLGRVTILCFSDSHIIMVCLYKAQNKNFCSIENSNRNELLTDLRRPLLVYALIIVSN